MKHFILIAFVLAVFASCNNKENKKTDYSKYKVTTLGRYVYVDKGNVIHSKKDCSAVFKKNNAQSVVPTNPKYIYTPDGDANICSKCVTTKQIEQIDSIINTVAYSERRWLYNELSKRNYDIPSWTIFNVSLNSIDNRRALYNGVKNEIDLDSFDEFNSSMMNYGPYGTSKQAFRRNNK